MWSSPYVLPRILLLLCAALPRVTPLQLATLSHRPPRAPLRPICKLGAEDEGPSVTLPHSPTPFDLPKAADTTLACAGAALGIYALGELERMTGVSFYAPPLAAGAIIIFSGIKPPPPKNVFGGMLGAASFALVLEAVGGGTETTRALAVAGSLLWFKSSGALFPPAAAAAVVFLDTPDLQELGLSYLMFPCLSGCTVLYTLA